MTIVETEWWSMALPPEWWAELEDESVLVGDRDEVGCIELSTLQKEAGSFTDDQVADIARSEAGDVATLEAIRLGEFRGYTDEFCEEGAAVREWYLASGGLLLFITYSCSEDNRGLDEAAVAEILDTLVVRR